MALPVATTSEACVLTPAAIGSTSLPQTTLSYRWVINDVQLFFNHKDLRTLPNGTIYSPTFEVILPLKDSRVSQWKLGIKAEETVYNLFGTYLYACKSPPQPASTTLQSPSENLEERDKSSQEQEVLMSNIYFSVLKFETNEYKHRVNLNPSKYVVGKEAKILLKHFNLSKENLSVYLDCETLTFQVEATLYSVINYSNSLKLYNAVVPADNIREDLGSLCQDDLFADVTITCGGKEFRAHKLILASQSPVFKKMFEIDMKERRSGVIEVSDITPTVMSDLLAYLYTGTAPHVDTLARELLNAANKYELPRLLSICETTLVSKITVDSVFKILIHAELHRAKILKNACLSFIKCNFARICELDSWNDMKTTNSPTHQMLVCEIFEYYHHSL